MRTFPKLLCSAEAEKTGVYGTLCDLDGQHVCGEFRLAFFAFSKPKVCVQSLFGWSAGWVVWSERLSETVTVEARVFLACFSFFRYWSYC